MTSSPGDWTDPDRLRLAMSCHQWFAQASQDLQNALIGFGRLVRLREGELLFDVDSPAQAMYFVLSGSLTVQFYDVDATIPTLIVAGAGHWFGELSLVDGKPGRHSAVADVPTCIWRVPHRSLHAWLDAHPAHWRDIAVLVAGKLRVSLQVHDIDTRRTMTQRVALRIRMLALGWGWRADAPRLQLELSQERLADMLGAARSSISKSVRELQSAGAIRVHYGVIEVVDMAVLAEMGRLVELPGERGR